MVSRREVDAVIISTVVVFLVFLPSKTLRDPSTHTYLMNPKPPSS